MGVRVARKNIWDESTDLWSLFIITSFDWVVKSLGFPEDENKLSVVFSLDEKARWEDLFPSTLNFKASTDICIDHL